MKLLKKLSPALTTILIAGVSYVVLFTLLAATISPERYDIRAGEVSNITITAIKDVEDVISTGKLTEAAARSVQPSYVSDASVQPAVLSSLQQAFSRLLGYRARTAPLSPDAPVTDGQRLEAEGALSPATASPETLDALVRLPSETLTSLYEKTFALVRETLSGKLPEGQEQEALIRIRRDLLSEDFSEGDADIALALVASTLRPNMLLDQETTAANRQRAMDEVEPIVYKKGQNIVRAGEVVTENQIAMLDDMGMIKDKRIDLSLYLGLGSLLMLITAMVALYMRAFVSPHKRDVRTVALMCLILVLTVLLSMLFRAVNTHLMPVALGMMLVALLIDARLAFVVNLALSVITGLLGSSDNGTFASTMFSNLLVPLVSGSIAIPMIKRRPQRLVILLSGLVIAAVNMASTLAMGLLGSANQVNVMTWALWAAGGGLLAAVLSIGLQPALEWLFNLVTPSKLMELSNPNQPLLRRLLLEAPGTYHHSILVANLAEAAASAVGADALLTRVGAYYHDIGKLKRPLYFKENQLTDNPHDRADPRVSTAILTAHPRDGVEMAQKARLPEAIQEIISQHHGDTPVLYFYDKAIKQGGDVDLSDFRYDGPRPRTREAAIVMLADTAEAAARAVPESTSDKIDALIRRLVRSKLEDGQLDDCPLTFADLSRICDAFTTLLIGVYHERVEYPNIQLPNRKKPEAAEPEPKPEPKPDAQDEPPAAEPEPQSEPVPDERPDDVPEESSDAD